MIWRLDFFFFFSLIPSTLQNDNAKSFLDPFSFRMASLAKNSKICLTSLQTSGRIFFCLTTLPFMQMKTHCDEPTRHCIGIGCCFIHRNLPTYAEFYWLAFSGSQAVPSKMYNFIIFWPCVIHEMRSMLFSPSYSDIHA